MTKNRFGLTTLILGLSASALGAFTYGCIGDDDPIAAADAGADTASPAADAAELVDPANCGHCINAFSPTCRTKAFCQHNDIGGGTSTSDLLLALNTCTCVEQCATECEQDCTGQGDVTPGCAACNATKCGALFQQYIADTNPNDPECNDPFGTVSDAGSDADAADPDAGDGG